MGRFRAKGSFRGRTRAGRSRPRWTAVIVSDTAVAGTADYVELVAPSDYATAAALEDSGTLLRIRGNLQLYNLSTTLAATFDLAIYAASEGDAALAVDAQSAYQQGNILWCKSIVLAAATAATTGAMAFAFQDIDIRSKRKLEHPQSSVWLAVKSVAGGGNVAYGGLFRSLLRLNA